MAGDQGVESWVEISDFTPGIYDSYGPSLPDGSAQRDGTFRCFGAPGGGLHPLPRHVATTSFTIPVDTTVPDYFPTDDLTRFQILSTEIVSPAIADAANETGDLGDIDQPDLLLYIFVWIYDEDGLATDYKRYFMAHRVSYFDGTTDSSSISRSFQTATLHSSRWFYRLGGSAVNIISHVGGGYKPRVIYADGSFDRWQMFDIIASGIAFVPIYMTAHQGRLVNTISVGRSAGYVGEYSSYFGTGAEFYNGLQVGACTFANNSTNAAPVNHLAQGTAFGAGIGLMQTIDSNTFLIVRTVDGGYVVRGDLTDPSDVIQFRSLPPTFDTIARPITHNKQVMYGNRRGVWAVGAGSDTARNLSPQFDSWFWGHDDMDPVQPFQALRGKFMVQEPWLYVPNNWVMDQRTGAWWRLEDPDILPYSWYDVSANGRVYASPSYITPSRQTLNHQYDPTLGATSWSWHSQPLVKTRNRLVNVRQVVVAVQGSGTVDITLNGMDGSTQTVSVSVNSTQPIIKSLPVNLLTHDIELVIESDSGDPDTAAPSLNRISLGYTLRHSVHHAPAP